VPTVRKPSFSVQRHAGGVEGKRREDQLVVAVLAGQLDEPREQDLAHALAAMAAFSISQAAGASASTAGRTRYALTNARTRR
jgi:hypothetical protein